MLVVLCGPVFLSGFQRGQWYWRRGVPLVFGGAGVPYNIANAIQSAAQIPPGVLEGTHSGS